MLALSSLILALWFGLFSSAKSQSWKRYPLTLEENQYLTFPGIEGAQYKDQGDSWFFTGEVEGETTGRRYQVVTIFDRNFTPDLILNFYQTSIFDYGTGALNTFTQYDLPPATILNMRFHAAAGHLNLSFNSSAGSAYWRSAKTPNDDLIPFEYNLRCPGIDHLSGAPFSFTLNMEMQNKPVAYGASTERGFFTFYGQKNTLTYWQPAPLMSGSIDFLGVKEKVKGYKGHIDRQIFPLYSGIFTPTGRQHSHEWRQINLDNGINLAIWRQFNRVISNTVIQTTGTTTSYPPRKPHIDAPPPTYVNGLEDDLTVEYISYAKYPRANYSTLLPPPSRNMYLPSAHIIRSKKLDMELHAEYVAPTPVAQLPIEYFEGPANWKGRYKGQLVTGVGIFESTLALYRDWELAEVLLNSVLHLPRVVFSSSAQQEQINRVVRDLFGMVSSDPLHDHRLKARKYALKTVIPALRGIRAKVDRSHILAIADDFVSSLDQ